MPPPYKNKLLPPTTIISVQPLTLYDYSMYHCILLSFFKNQIQLEPCYLTHWCISSLGIRPTKRISLFTVAFILKIGLVGRDYFLLYFSYILIVKVDR